MRNSNIIIGVCNVLGYIFLTWWIGVQGAAVTKLFAGATYVLVMVWYYQRLIRSPENEKR